MRQRRKRWVFSMRGKDPGLAIAVVKSRDTDRPHVVIEPLEGVTRGAAAPRMASAGMAAAFAVSGLTGVYELLQGVLSSVVGRVVDRNGFTHVCLAVAVLPLASWAALAAALRRIA